MSAHYKILSYNTWNELKKDIAKDICGSDSLPYNRFVFRGQSCEKWKLITTFDRKYGGLAFDERQKIEKALINDFKELCITWNGKVKFLNYTIVELMSVGQHYGLPTRLLDWTYSFYIAAFFAFADIENTSSHVVIWVIDKEHEIWNAGYGVSIESVKVEENDRQKYQYGIFSLNKSPFETIEDYVESCSREHLVDGALYKIVLPVDEKKIVLRDLEMMGINASILYRGMEGCAKSAVLREFMK